MSKRQGPATVFASTCALVFLGCVLLYLAVVMIERIWVALLVGALIAFMTWIIAKLIKWRRDRW